MTAVGFHSVLSDGFDRQLFDHALDREPALVAAVERVGRLLPHPRALLCDLFSALYKLNVVILPAEEVSPAVLVQRRLLAAVAASEALARLRTRTQLDEVESGAGAALLAEHLLTALTRDHRVLAEELVDAAGAAHDEAALDEARRQLEHLPELPEGLLDPATRDRLRRALEGEARALEARLEEARARQGELADSLPAKVEAELDWKVGRLDEQLDELESTARSLGLGAGSDGRVSAGARLELGRRLLESKELRLLARLVGAFREVAFEARRRRISRAPQELHEVRLGADLGRLLPSELLGLDPARKALHLEFLRRFVEGRLLQYDLQAAAERGPMVVCLDGSGSMRGSKELWGKAVALTLMEIARRERRRCLALVFSSGHDLYEVELVDPGVGGGRGAIRDDDVLRFAEHFPGGGTSFEEPLDRATSAVAEGRYRRGDVVFITDGEAHVSEALLARIEERRRRHRFRIRGVLVDVQHSREGTLERFCDDVRRVSDLTADSLSDLFGAV